MQMYSLFDVNAVTVSEVKTVDDVEPLTYYRRIDVRYNGGSTMITLYANSERELEVNQEIVFIPTK